jgi:NADP-dependent 3-hydroxy acid dehydrogenase YdfG
VKRDPHGLVVLITGASSGIGRALAVEADAAGAKLVLAARRDDRLATLNGELGGGHFVQTCDVADPEQCRRLVEASIQHFGRIDVVVANAGYGISKPTWKQTPDEVRRLFATNVHGTHDLIHHAVPRMLEQEPVGGLKGHLVIVSSAAARRGLPFFGPYAATKAAQLSLAEALRVELADKGVAVTSVHPVGTTTEFFDVAERDGETRVAGIGSRATQQTAEHVAGRILNAIRRPTVREVWPARVFRYLLGMTAFSPGIGDRVMNRMKGEIERGQ